MMISRRSEYQVLELLFVELDVLSTFFSNLYRKSTLKISLMLTLIQNFFNRSFNGIFSRDSKLRVRCYYLLLIDC